MAQVRGGVKKAVQCPRGLVVVESGVSAGRRLVLVLVLLLVLETTANFEDEDE